MPDRSRARFGELERAVLDALWGSDGAPRPVVGWHTVREVHEVLAARREIAYTTVMTVLDRMTVKGVVEREKSGRTNHYRAVDSRGTMTAELMRDALGEFGQVDRRTALVAFVDDASDDDRRALRDALAELERRSS